MGGYMAGEMSAKEYLLTQYKEKEARFNELTRFDADEKLQYAKLLENLISVNSNNEISRNEKGKALEDIVSFLLVKTNIFKVQKNLHTGTNEIDQIVELGFIGKEFKSQIDILGDVFLGECKNYNKSVGVTWVGKFYSLLETTCRLGVIFSYFGLSGKGWHDASGLVRKLHINKEDFNRRFYIIDFNVEDFKLVNQGQSFLNILQAKISGLRTDTDYLKHVSKHPAQEQ